MTRLTYIEILKHEFKFRREKNLTYSLRRFAADLDLNPIHFHKIINNKCGISRAKAEKIARKLHLPYIERRKFILLVTAASSRSHFQKNLAKMGLRNQELLAYKKRI
jgi:hypothetical protein